jgi:hypothetical protein
LIKGALNSISEPEARANLFNSLAGLYKKEGDDFQRALAMQRSLKMSGAAWRDWPAGGSKG